MPQRSRELQRLRCDNGSNSRHPSCSYFRSQTVSFGTSASTPRERTQEVSRQQNLALPRRDTERPANPQKAAIPPMHMQVETAQMQESRAGPRARHQRQREILYPPVAPPMGGRADRGLNCAMGLARQFEAISREPTMPKQQTHLPVVRQWLQSLGVLSAISISRDEAEMKLAAFTPMLMQRFPDAAFTTESLEHVARCCNKGFPNYGELADCLSEWWLANRPMPPALPPPDLPWRQPDAPQREPPTPEECAAVHTIVQEITARLRAHSVYTPGVSRPLPDEPCAVMPRYLPPELLDRLNPLPNGRKRTDAAQLSAPVAKHSETAQADAPGAAGAATSGTTGGAA